MMDLRHMRHFVAVAEELHFRRAAQRLNMAQPPLSQSIKRLEDYLGAKLLERSRSGVSLTPAGKVFMEEARRTLTQAELAREMTVRAAQRNSSLLHVSFTTPAMFELLPPILFQYHGVNPSIEIRLTQRTSSAKQAADLLHGGYDVAFTRTSAEIAEGFERLVVERSRYIALIPENWPLARNDSVTLKELGSLPMIMVPREVWPDRVERELAAFSDAGVTPHIVQESTLTNNTMSLVAQEMGCALSVETAAASGMRGIAFRPISDMPPDLCWETALVWSSHEPTTAVQMFVAFVRGYLKEHPELLEYGP